MRKRALKKRREELRELLADRREALGELVLGMHVQGVWDDGLLARGAAEVREVEDGLAELDDGSVEVGEETSAASGPAVAPGLPTGEEARPDEAEAGEEEAGEKGRGRRRRKSKEAGDDTALAGSEDQAAVEPTAHPEFETAEHTAEHRLPAEPLSPPEPEDQPSEPNIPEAAPVPSPPEPPPPIETRSEEEGPTPEPVAAPEERSKAPPSSPPVAPEPTPAEAPGKPERPPRQVGAAAAPSEPSRLDQLEAKLEREEREARTGVESARASAGAETGTEVASLIETLKKDRQSLEQALGAASRRLSEADRKAGEASDRASRLEAENREAAARWVREQAAEIEADAAVAAELTGDTGPAPVADERRIKDLEGEVTSLRSQLEDERREKTRAIEAAESRLREIEARAAEVEAGAIDRQTEGGGPDAAELREAAVGWLRGQIVALRREIEAGGGRDGGES